MSKAKTLYRKVCNLYLHRKISNQYFTMIFQRIRSFPREIWIEDEKTNFGTQRLSGIELLSMMETDPITKYYKSVAEFKFEQNPADNNISENL
jgi:hypothetical protein